MLRSCLLLFTVSCVLGVPLLGCREQSITRDVYSIPAEIDSEVQLRKQAIKQFESGEMQPPMMGKQPGAQIKRMLAAMVLQPNAKRFWTLKLSTQQPQQLDEVKEAVQNWIKTISWENTEKKLPRSELPSGWKLVPQTDQFGRMGTLTIPTANGTELQLAIAAFELQDEWARAVLSNINRWRGQVGLDALDSGANLDAATKLPIKDAEVLFWDLVKSESDSPAVPPMSVAPSKNNAEPTAKPDLFTDQPAADWKPNGSKSLRLMTYEINNDAGNAEIAISRFPASAQEIAKPLPNAIRWGAEVGVQGITAESLDQYYTDVQLAGKPAKQFTATGPSRQTIAVMQEHEGFVWFIKLTGSAPAVKLAEPSFTEYLRSFQYR
jgi:hypothetical protein